MADCWDVVRGKEVQKIKNWGKLFMVQFEITISNSGEGWINVFHFTAHSDNSNYGDRIPAMWIKRNNGSEAGRFHIASAISDDKDMNKEYDYELGKKYQITIKQFKDNENMHWYEIIINTESIFKMQNIAPQSFPNVKLYASDPWYSSFSSYHGSVCNFSISSFDAEVDCCYQETVGDEHFCASGIPCKEDEGDCDSHNECQDGLSCGSNNCPIYLGFNNETDCCCCCDLCTTDDPCNYNGLEITCDNVAMLGFCMFFEGFANEYCKRACNVCSGISACECQDQNISGLKKKQHVEYRIQKVMESLKLTPTNMAISRKQHFDLEHEILPDSHSTLLKHKRRRKSHRNLLASKATMTKTSSTKSSGPTELKKSHHASSNFGLTVVLNPKVPEYTNALKNSFTGFKTLVHTPYDFAEVDAIGMAIDQNIRSYIGIRGYHSWTTEAANVMDLKHKRCLARTDDLTKYHDVRVDIFANYTKKGCVLECYANLYYDMCKCIPYHYPDFTKAWHVN